MLKRIKALDVAHRACIVLLGLHFVFSLAYSLITPLWEPPDEIGHYTYAQYIAAHAALPLPGAKLSEYNEAHQPPLYYCLVALAISWIDTSDNIQPKFTPLATYIANTKPDLHLAPAGQVMMVPDTQINAFPYRGTALAVHVGRLVSVILSTITVLLTYLTVRILLPSRADIALLATAIHALWPEFLFMGGAINNDAGIALFGSLVLWLLARLIICRPSQRPLTYGAVAACLAGAILSKDSAISLLLCSGLVVSALASIDLVRHQGRRLIDLVYLLMPLAVLIAAGAWVSDGRSIRQFSGTAGFVATSVGQVTANNTANIGSVDPVPQSVGQAQSDGQAQSVGHTVAALPGNLWHGSLETLFAVFGGSFIYLPPQWYDIVRLGAVVVALSLLAGLTRKGMRVTIILALVCLICVALAPVIRSVLAHNVLLLTGRFFLPGLGAICILAAVGLYSLPRLLDRLGATFVFGGVALTALLSPFVAMAPAYRPPTLLDPVAIPGSMQVPDPITYGGVIQLLGYSQPLPKTTQGGPSLIELYWRALEPIDKDYILRIETFSLEGQSFRERLDAFPGHNVSPTSFWKPGDTFSEIYYLPVKSDVPAPSLATFKVTWLDPDTGKALEPICADRKTCDAKVGALPVALADDRVTQWADKSAPFRLGVNIELLDFQAPASVQAGRAISLSIVWRARAAGLPALTTFVHLLSTNGTLVAQRDSPPRNGFYPVNMWSGGEIIPDQYAIQLDPALQPGKYRLLIGMYDPKTVERIPAFDASGTALRDNAISLQDIEVR